MRLGGAASMAGQLEARKEPIGLKFMLLIYQKCHRHKRSRVHAAATRAYLTRTEAVHAFCTVQTHAPLLLI